MYKSELNSSVLWFISLIVQHCLLFYFLCFCRYLQDPSIQASSISILVSSAILGFRLRPFFCLCFSLTKIVCHYYFAISEYKKSLENAISGDTSGHFRRLLISLAQVQM